MINYPLCWHLHWVIYGSLIEPKRGLVDPAGAPYNTPPVDPAQSREQRRKEGEGCTNVSAPWLEMLFTKEFKICFWELRWTSPGIVSWVPHAQTVLLSGNFEKREGLCCQLCAWWPTLLDWEDHTGETLRGARHWPRSFMNLLHYLGKVTQFLWLQIRPLWSEGIRWHDLRIFLFSSKKTKNSLPFTSFGVGLTPPRLVIN